MGCQRKGKARKGKKGTIKRCSKANPVLSFRPYASSTLLRELTDERKKKKEKTHQKKKKDGHAQSAKAT